MKWNALKWNEVKWNEMLWMTWKKWNEMKWNDMKWNDMKCFEWNEMKWNGMNCNEWMNGYKEMGWKGRKGINESTMKDGKKQHLLNIWHHVRGILYFEATAESTFSSDANPLCPIRQIHRLCFWLGMTWFKNPICTYRSPGQQMFIGYQKTGFESETNFEIAAGYLGQTQFWYLAECIHMYCVRTWLVQNPTNNEFSSKHTSVYFWFNFWTAKPLHVAMRFQAGTPFSSRHPRPLLASLCRRKVKASTRWRVANGPWWQQGGLMLSGYSRKGAKKLQ